MAILCRTCGKYAANPRALFDDNGADMLNDLLKLTGIWLTEKAGFPSHICSTCIQHSNQAMAFRDLCIRTNKHWYASADSQTIDDAVHLDSPKENDIAELAEENTEYFIVKILTPCEEINSENYATENSEKLANDGDCNDESCDLDPLLSISKEEDNDKAKVRSSPLSNADPPVKKQWYKSTHGFCCDQCGRSFTNKGNLYVHLKRHTGVRQFECEECGRKEFTMHLLRLHMRVKHNGELPYSCNYCGQGFDNCKKRLRHERTTHKECPDYRIHVCHVCDRSFKLELSLKRHALVHLGEQRFRCEICDINFTRNANLRAHNRSQQHKKRVGEDQTTTQINESTGEL